MGFRKHWQLYGKAYCTLGPIIIFGMLMVAAHFYWRDQFGDINAWPLISATVANTSFGEQMNLGGKMGASVTRYGYVTFSYSVGGKAYYTEAQVPWTSRTAFTSGKQASIRYWPKNPKIIDPVVPRVP